MKKIIFSCLMLIGSLVVNAHRFEVGGFYYNITSDVEPYSVEVTYKGSAYSNYNEYSGEITIPQTVTYEGITYSVSSIGKDAFAGSSIEKITIPPYIKEIGSRAFHQCNYLSEVRIEDGANSLFVAENRITSNSSSSYPEVEGLFSVQPITTIYIGRTLKYDTYDSGSSELCSPFYDGYKSVFNKNLKSITVGSLVEEIGPYLFAECDSIIEMTLGEKISLIDRYAFYGCNNLKNVYIGNNVSTIGKYAFAGSGIVNITIPSRVNEIGNGAFSDCVYLSEVIIEDGDSILHVGYNKYTKSSLSADPEVEGIFSVQPINTFYMGRTLAYEIYNTLNSDRCSPFYNSYKNKGNNYLKNITISPFVKEIGTNLFAECDSLTNILIGENVSAIGDYAFYGNDNLREITIVDKVEAIGKYAFYNCKELTDVAIGKNVMTIGDYAFGCNIKLKNIIWNARNCANFSSKWLQSASAYSDETLISSMIFGDSVNCIPSLICANQKMIQNVNIGASVKSIGLDAFAGVVEISAISWNAINCSDFTNTPFIDSKETIGQFSFGAKVEYIPSYLCNGMSKIASITIPNGVKSIGNYAFYGCNNLGKIYARPTLPPVINDNTFSSVIYENSTLYVYENSESAYSNDDLWLNFFNISTLSGGATTAIQLAIEYPEGAIIKHEYDYNKTAKLNITPAEEWVINTITFNDEDITAQLDENGNYTTPKLTSDSRISIVIKMKDSQTEIEPLLESDIKVYAKDGIVSILGVDESEESVIYDVKGEIIYKGIDKEISLNRKGVFILSVAEKTFKFIL